MKNDQRARPLASGTPASLAVLLAVGIACDAHAQLNPQVVPPSAPQSAPQSTPEAPAAAAAAQASPAPASLWTQSSLFGDIGGLRPLMAGYGVTFGLQETSEYVNNLSGGTRRGGAYDGVTQVGIGVDTQKAFGLPGGMFNVSALQIHGTDLTARNLQTLQFATGAEADASTRLWELWYQQSLAGGKVDVKIGQQSLDQEFMVSQYAAAFINASFGWSVLPSTDLPGGGPAYPLSSPGVRVRATPSDGLTVLGGVFGGDPAHGRTGDPQQLDASGTNFSLRGGGLVIGEVQLAINPDAAASTAASAGTQPRGLPGTYKLGFWYDSNRFADQGFDNTGLSLANPASTGSAASHRGNYSLYAVADQMVWRAGPDSPQAVGVFARVMGAPGDRNLVDLGVNAGITMTAPFKGRDKDTVGLAVGYAHIGSHARELASREALDTPGFPSRSAETLVEATYQYQVAPWWQLQADFQYVFRPAGGVPDPDNPAQRIGNEAIVGMRTVVTF
jgi:porin